MEKPTLYTLYFYKGTTFPYMYIKEEEGMKWGKEQILRGQQENISLKEQADLYRNQLDFIEDAMCKFCNPTSERGLKKLAKKLKKDVHHLYAIWSMNICSLLILKGIPDDDKFGIFTIKGHD